MNLSKSVRIPALIPKSLETTLKNTPAWSCEWHLENTKIYVVDQLLLPNLQLIFLEISG